MLVSLILITLTFQEKGSDGDEAEYLVETTVKVQSTGGGLIRASAPILREWPEQRIEQTPVEAIRCKVRVDEVAPAAAALDITTASLRSNEIATVVYRQRVFAKPQAKRTRSEFPRVPEIDGKIKQYLMPTPTIDSKHPAIRAKAAEICSGADSAWLMAERLSLWTHHHVAYKMMDYSSAKAAFETKVGDCEERSALFVAMCRSQGIPARIVLCLGKTRREAGHCWSEILLADSEGNAEWLPVDVDMRWFAERPIPAPVLQKGDSYPKVLGGSGRQRLLGSWARGGSGKLTFEFEQNVTPVTPNAVLDPTTTIGRSMSAKP